MKNALRTVIIIIILLFAGSTVVGGTDSELLDSTYFEEAVSPPNTALNDRIIYSYGTSFVYSNSSNNGSILGTSFCSINITNEYTETSKTTHGKGYFKIIMYENTNTSTPITFTSDYRFAGGMNKYHSCHMIDLGGKLMIFTAGPNPETNNATLNNPTFSYGTLLTINPNNPSRFEIDNSSTVNYTGPAHTYPSLDIVNYKNFSRYVSSVYIKSEKSLFVLFALEA